MRCTSSNGKPFQQRCSLTRRTDAAFGSGKGAAFVGTKRNDGFTVPLMGFHKRINTHRKITPPNGITDINSVVTVEVRYVGFERGTCFAVQFGLCRIKQGFMVVNRIRRSICIGNGFGTDEKFRSKG